MTEDDPWDHDGEGRLLVGVIAALSTASTADGAMVLLRFSLEDDGAGKPAPAIQLGLRSHHVTQLIEALRVAATGQQNVPSLKPAPLPEL